jgi:hypothetical protein
VLVAYHIDAGPDGTVPQIPGVPKRCEFDKENCIKLTHQHYIISLQLDKAIAEIEFFWRLKLRKSRADAMLNRLTRGAFVSTSIRHGFGVEVSLDIGLCHGRVSTFKHGRYSPGGFCTALRLRGSFIPVG